MRLLISFVALLPTGALAVPVTVDFVGGTALYDGDKPPADVDGIAVDDGHWSENGFDVQAAGQWARDEEEAERNSIVDGPFDMAYAMTNFQSTYATGLEAQVTDYVITRGDGRAFDFTGLAASESHAQSISYLYEFEGGTTESELVDNAAGFVDFTGIRTDGSTVTALRDVEFAQDIDFEDIVRLDVSWSFDTPEGFRYECDPRNLARREFAALGTPDACPDSERAPGVAAISGGNEREDLISFTNYQDIATVEGFAFDVNSELAPIPVPAALPLLAGGLGLLAWAGRRRAA